MAHFENGDLELSRRVITELLVCKRPTVKRWAAKFIIEHERELYKHENPATQLHKVTHTVPDKITIELVRPAGGGA